MTAIIPLGKFEKVALRDAWPTEDGNFTPWLAHPESIALLGDTLHLSLEFEERERQIGEYRADIIAQVTDEPETHRVIIENQFGRTDHGHLGQILAYLAGMEGTKTVVWIAEEIRQEHRAAIDWLNAHTDEEFSFFAVEVELWRIGNSAPAPRFNVIASPNDWTKTARRITRQIDEAALADSHKVRLAYWAAFADYLKKKTSTFRINRPNKDHWKWFSIGRAGFGISATISTEKERIGVELYIANDETKAAFHALQAHRSEIEAEFGETLDWQELPGRKAVRIALFLNGTDPSNEQEYPKLHEWMLEKMIRFKQVFAPRVKDLTLLETSDDGEAITEN